MPETKPEDNTPKEKSKISIKDNDSEAVKNKGVNFLSGALLVVLVVAAIGSFSIVAMELGEIKRLVGLKESTGKEIKENEQKISTFEDEISKLIENKKLSDESAKESESKARKMADYASGWEKIAQDKANNSKENTRLISDNSELISENGSLNKTLSGLKSQKSLLEAQIKDLESAKEELSKYPVLIANKKAELDKINAQKQLAVQAKDQAESALIELKTQITSLEQEKRKALEEIKKNEVTAKFALKELEDAKTESSLLKGQTAALLEAKSESQTRNNILVTENSELATERDALNAEILKLNKDLGKRRADLNKLIQSYDQWDRVVKSKKAEAQNQSNQ